MNLACFLKGVETDSMDAAAAAQLGDKGDKITNTK